jgi:hypothetical protein
MFFSHNLLLLKIIQPKKLFVKYFLKIIFGGSYEQAENGKNFRRKSFQGIT